MAAVTAAAAEPNHHGEEGEQKDAHDDTITTIAPPAAEDGNNDNEKQSDRDNRSSSLAPDWQGLKDETAIVVEGPDWRRTSTLIGSVEEKDVELADAAATSIPPQNVAEVMAGSGGGDGGLALENGKQPSGHQAGESPRQQEDEQEPQYKVYRRRWFGLIQLVLLNIIVSWDWLTFSPVASQAATYFGTSESTINWLSTAFLFAFPFAAPATIWVLHLGPKPSIVAAASLVLVGNWVRYAGAHSSAGGNLGAVMFGQILTGLAQPFVLSAPSRYSDLWFTDRGRVGATALTSLANPFGAALGELIVPFWVSTPADIPNMVLYVSVIATVFCIPAFFFPAAPPTPVAPSSATPKMSLGASVRALCGHVEFWLLFTPFAVYVGFFNSLSSLLNQVMLPYGFSDTDAGIAGALLIVVGLVSSAVTSPLLDRTKTFVGAVRVAVPLVALCYLVFVWMPPTRAVLGPYLVLCVLGAASFSLLPIVVELLVELTHPVSPEVTSVLAWSGGQLFGGLFIIISDALKAGEAASPPGNMRRALIFQAVVALVVMPVPMFLGCFGRRDKLVLRRVEMDRAAARNSIVVAGGGGLEGVVAQDAAELPV